MDRRTYLMTMAGALAPAARGAELVVETHVHIFSADLKRFPNHPNGPKLKPAPLEEYLKFARAVGIAHAVHVSAEPYQDDLRYLEETLRSAPAGFLKGTILFDPTGAETPRRMEEIVRRHPGKILAMRIHCNRPQGSPPRTEGPLRDRDLGHPGVRAVWSKAGELGIAIQPHIMPWFAPDVERLAREFPRTRVILDHFGHGGVGGAEKGPDGWRLVNGKLGYDDPREFDVVLRLAKLPQVILKVSGLQYSSRAPFPHRDVGPLARRAFDAFGPDRMVWGSLGATLDDFRKRSEIFDANFGFLSAADRAKIRGGTAKRLFFS